MALTAEDIAAQVKATMQQQQVLLLDLAERRSKQLMDERDRRAEAALRDYVDEQILVRQPGLTWRNEINRSNYNALAEIQTMWERTERFVAAMEPREGHGELKDGAEDFIRRGKALVHNRLKVLRFADRDGWSAAMNFLGDDIADDETEAKKMKRGKKEAEKAKAAKEKSLKEKASSARHRQVDQFRDRSGRRERDYGDDRSQRFEKRRSERNNDCYICGRTGHFARLALSDKHFCVNSIGGPLTYML